MSKISATKREQESEGFWLGLQAGYDLEECRRMIFKQLKHIGRLVTVSNFAATHA